MGGGTGTGEENFSKSRKGLRKLSTSEGNFLHKVDLIGKLINKIPNHKEINGMDFISNLQLVDRNNKDMNYLHRAEIILSGESEGNLFYVFGIEENIAAVSLFRAGFHCRVIRTECVTEADSDIPRIPHSQALG